jgi:ABC-2 type transport system ATP-binding protein
MMQAIEINNLCIQYPGFALKNVSFSVPDGLCWGFLRPNGAKKTTTLKSMFEMTQKDSGEIRLFGRAPVF